MATNDKMTAYYAAMDNYSRMRGVLWERMTQEEKEKYWKCEASFSRQDALLKKLAEKYGVKHVEYPELPR